MIRLFNLFKTAVLCILAVTISVSCEKGVIDLPNDPPKPAPAPTPVPEPEPEPAELLDLSDSNSKVFKVMNVDLVNKSVELLIPEDQLPEVGDILASGSTDEAPYGYLYSVKSVTAEPILSTRATWDEIKDFVGDQWADYKDFLGEFWESSKEDWSVLYHAHVYCSEILLHDALKLVGALDGKWHSLKEEKVLIESDNGTQILPEFEDTTKTLKFSAPITIPGKYLSKKSESFTITPTIEMAIEKFRYYLSSEMDGEAIKMGVDSKLKAKLNVHINGKDSLYNISGDFIKQINGFTPVITFPYTFYIDKIPVVVTLVLKMTAPYELSGSVDADIDLIDYNCYFNLGAYWDTFNKKATPLENRDKVITQEPIDSDGDSNNYSLSLNFNGTFGIDYKVSVGLYGANIFDFLTLGINTGAKIEASYKLGTSFTSHPLTQNPVRVTDIMQFDVYQYSKTSLGVFPEVDWTTLDDLLSFKKEIDLFRYTSYCAFGIPSFTRLKVASLANNNETITIKAKELNAIYKIKSLMLADRGFCLEKTLDPNVEFFSVNNAKIATSGWRFVYDPEDEERKDEDLDISYNLPIPLSKLERNVKYSLYPYTKLKDGTIYYGEGIDFVVSENGQVSVNLIDDVPGEIL